MRVFINKALFGFFFFAASFAHAKDFYDLFSTPMGMSMGGAISAYVDDWNSLYYNPAGLAYVQKFQLRAPDFLHLELSDGAWELFKKLQNTDNSEPIATQLKKFDGETGSFRVNPLNFGLFFRQVGFGLNVADVRMSVRLLAPTLIFARAFYDARTDSGISAGYGHSFYGDHFRVGFAMRLLSRVGSAGFLEGEALATLGGRFQQLAGAGIGIDGDIGAQGNLDELKWGWARITPMAGVVFQNILASQYNLIRIQRDTLTGTPPPNERRINAGVALKITGLGPLTVIPSFELRDLLIDTTSFWEYVSAGAQIGLNTGYWVNGFLRSAYYKGSYTAGIGGNLGPGELEFGTYGVSLGQGFGVGFDRRYYFKLALKW